MPGPVSSQCTRSFGEASASRGYHSRGTDTVRPSRNSTTRTRSVISTLLAAGVSAARFEVVIPCLKQVHFVAPYQRRNAPELVRAETVVIFHVDRREPNLSNLSLARNMDMRRL